jgi:hypothetical protein
MAGAFSPYASPISNPASWDSIVVQGTTWTGKVDVKRATRAYRWQNKEPPGADGEFSTFRGKKGKTFGLEFYLWTDTHFANWAVFQTNFYYQGAKAGVVNPISVQHPALAYIGINTVIVEDIGSPEKVSDDLMFKVVVTVREFMPPLPVSVTKTPTGPAATVNPTPGTPPNPVIQSLETELNGLRTTAGNMNLPGGQ